MATQTLSRENIHNTNPCLVLSFAYAVMVNLTATTTGRSRFIVYSPSSFVKKVLPVSTKLNVKQANNLLYLCEVKQREQNEPPTNTKGQLCLAQRS
jgi:hypothetical protein